MQLNGHSPIMDKCVDCVADAVFVYTTLATVAIATGLIRVAATISSTLITAFVGSSCIRMTYGRKDQCDTLIRL